MILLPPAPGRRPIGALAAGTRFRFNDRAQQAGGGRRAGRPYQGLAGVVLGPGRQGGVLVQLDDEGVAEWSGCVVVTPDDA